MNKNVLLTIAYLICIFLCIAVAITFLISIGILVHWHFDPDYYSKVSLVEVDFRPNNFLGFTQKESWTIGNEKVVNQFTLNKIKAPFLYFIYIQFLAMKLVVFLILREFLDIIKSVRLVQSFRTRNIGSFRKIGKYLFIFFLLSSFYIVIVEQGKFYGFYIHLTPLVLMLIAFIMGEVFKEGNSLLEENQLTV